MMSNEDISLEPLFNQSSEGIGVSKKIAMVPINTAGAGAHKTPVTVTDSEAEITITAGKRTIEIQNISTTGIVIFYGGTGVDDTTGIKLFPNQLKVYANIQDTFSIFVVCATGESAELRLVEYA